MLTIELITEETRRVNLVLPENEMAVKLGKGCQIDGCPGWSCCVSVVKPCIKRYVSIVMLVQICVSKFYFVLALM